MIGDLSLIELTVRDWPASVDWYRDVLGLKLLVRDESNRFALFDTGTVRLALKAGEAVSGGVLIALEVQNLPAALEGLAAKGVFPAEAVKISEEGYRRVILNDPEGYRVSLFDWHRESTSKAGTQEV